MIEVKNIKSNTRPVETDETSCDAIVYVRYNIEEHVETDPIFDTENTYFTYDETQYTRVEWDCICRTVINAKLDELTGIVDMILDELGNTTTSNDNFLDILKERVSELKKTRA